MPPNTPIPPKPYAGQPTRPTTLDPEAARGARKVGFIWILGVSTTLAIVAMLGFWAFSMGALSDSQADSDTSKAAAAQTFDTPAPPASAP